MSHPLLPRAWCTLATLLFGLAALPVAALEVSEPPPAEVLTLDAARRIAVDHQPMLEAQALAIDAARESAVAARQLPDPQLKGGVSDLTITGDHVGTLTRQNDTQFTVGIAQAFPRADKRRLRGERIDAEAGLAERQLRKDGLSIERDVGLAWLDVWKPLQALTLARASEREAQLQLDALRIAYRNGRSAQADVRAATVALELLRDQIAKLEQDGYHARGALSRWLGEAAYAPLPAGTPVFPEPPPLGAMLEALRRHPHVDIAAAEVEVAAADVALAKQAYRPDFSVEVGYGHRPAFSDYINLQVGIDLPVFTANRQDRGLAARQAELARAEALREDSWREHAAELRLNHWDWTLLGQRLSRYDETILPEADARIEAARLAWAAGSGSLAAVLEARRAALDLRLSRLDLETDRSRHALALRYLGATADTYAAGAH
ncbi:TolC family protein [Nevskia ramosa]|uniref:TolC family protein n=1 Tax=Nevskia ramosa TaxID=64002 RepID=UPI002357138A|nr:TolC family protein [Nevskia ramosa]